MGCHLPQFAGEKAVLGACRAEPAYAGRVQWTSDMFMCHCTMQGFWHSVPWHSRSIAVAQAFRGGRNTPFARGAPADSAIPRSSHCRAPVKSVAISQTCTKLCFLDGHLKLTRKLVFPVTCSAK